MQEHQEEPLSHGPDLLGLLLSKELCIPRLQCYKTEQNNAGQKPWCHLWAAPLPCQCMGAGNDVHIRSNCGCLSYFACAGQGSMAQYCHMHCPQRHTLLHEPSFDSKAIGIKHTSGNAYRADGTPCLQKSGYLLAMSMEISFCLRESSDCKDRRGTDVVGVYNEACYLCIAAGRWAVPHLYYKKS